MAFSRRWIAVIVFGTSLPLRDKPVSLPKPGLLRQARLMPRMFSDPAPVLDALAAEVGPNFQLGMPPSRMAVISDPAAMRTMFAMPIDNFVWGHKFNVLGFVVGDKSMIVSDGEDHRRRRSSVQAAFTRRRLNGWIPMIVQRTDAAINGLLAEIGDGAEIDMYTVGRSLVLDIVVRAMFGERLAENVDEIGERFQRPQDYLESPVFRQIPHPVPGTRRAKVRADRRALDAMIDEEIERLRASSRDEDHDPLDVLASLVDGGSLSDQEIRDQVVTLMGAGYDTTAASLGWMIWCVSLTSGLWADLRAEADRVFGERAMPNEIDHHTLASLQLAKNVMRETTRLHPAGVVSPREAARDLVIEGFKVPKGTLILWSAHLAGRNEDAWSDPLTFDPRRFDGIDDDQRKLADMAWVPFGRGARNCIGFALAQMELTLIVSRIAQRLDIETMTGEKPRPVGMVVNRPEGGTPMRVAPRRDGQSQVDARGRTIGRFFADEVADPLGVDFHG